MLWICLNEKSFIATTVLEKGWPLKKKVDYHNAGENELLKIKN